MRYVKRQLQSKRRIDDRLSRCNKTILYGKYLVKIVCMVWTESTLFRSGTRPDTVPVRSLNLSATLSSELSKPSDLISSSLSPMHQSCKSGEIPQAFYKVAC